MAKVGVIFLTWRRYLQRGVNPYGVTLKQLYVLRHLDRKEFLYPSRIADMLFCDRPTATVVIRNMEREHWVRREKDSENAKQTRVILTPEGRQKLSSVSSHREDGGFDPLECLTEAERAQLDQLLNKLGRHMEKIE